jgi:hypothetical protein
MSLACITMPSVEVPRFNRTNFVSWKSQMSSYLREMNPQIWWMVDVDFFMHWRIVLKLKHKRNAYISKLMHLKVYLVP